MELFSTKMEEINYCLVCLTTDVKLFALKLYSLDDIYSDLTQVKIENLNLHVCFECASYLKKYYRFKLKCIRAYGVWSRIIKLPELTKSYLSTLQNCFNLAPNLVFSEINTEDIIEINTSTSTVANIAKVVGNESVHNYKNINFDASDDRNNSNMYVSHHSDEEKPSLCLEPKLEVYTHDVEDTQSNKYVTSDDEINESYNSEISIEQDKKIEYEQHSDEYSLIQIIPSHNSENVDNESNSNQIESTNVALTLNIEEEYDNVDIVPQVKNKCLSRNKNTSHLKNKELIVESIKVPDSQTTEKQEMQTIKNQPLLRITNVKPKKKKKALTHSEKQEKYDGLSRKKYLERENARSIKILKKYGTLTFFTQQEAKNDVLARANTSNYRYSLFKCNLCFRGFEKQNTFDNHNLISHNKQKGKYECDNCGSRFPIKKLLAKHLKVLHYFRFKCLQAGCSFVCYQIIRARQHLDLHTGIKYKCKYCKLEYNVESSMVIHMYTTHQNEYENEYICDICGRLFVTAKGLRTHEVRLHINDKNYLQGPECKECKIHFATEQAWRLHLVLSRNHEVANGCDQCGETFGNSADLAFHMKKHVKPCSSRKIPKPEQSNICQICGFKSKNGYRHGEHMFNKHDVPKEKPPDEYQHVCEICGRTFKAMICLKLHRRTHTNERPYKCRYCDKTFRVANGKRKHENVHTRARIYKCDLCDKEFLRDTSLRSHLQVHHNIGNAKHKCTECERHFFHLYQLKDHVLHKHQKVPYPKKNNRQQKKKS